VNTYQKKNHTPKPPNPKHLHLLANHHANHEAEQKQRADASNEENFNKGEDNDNNNSRPVQKKRAPHNSKGPKNPTLITLGFYPPGWKVMLGRAKDKFIYYIATTHTFPECSLHLCEAEQILKCNIDNFEEEGGILKDSLSF